jgi:hypothetical protein
MRPTPDYAGKAAFDGQLVDVIAEGMPIGSKRWGQTNNPKGSGLIVGSNESMSPFDWPQLWTSRVEFA